MSAEATLKQLRDESIALSRAIPDTMRAFQGLMKAASSDGAVSAKMKELIATAIAIATKCEGCLAFHVHNAVRHGASRNELAEIIGVAIEMGGGPATVYGGKALAAFDEFHGAQ